MPDQLLCHDSRINQFIDPATNSIQAADELIPNQIVIFAHFVSFIIFWVHGNSRIEEASKLFLVVSDSKFLIELVFEDVCETNT